MTCEFIHLWDAIAERVFNTLGRQHACPYQVLHMEFDRESVVVHLISEGDRHEQAG